MARTRQAVIQSPTADPNEVLVVFNIDGTLRNVLLRNAGTTRTTLLATPVGDAGRAAAEEPAYLAAEAILDGETVAP